MEALAARLGSHMRLDREKAVRELGQQLDTGGAAAVVAAEAVARELLTTGGRWEALHGGILAGILLTQTGGWVRGCAVELSPAQPPPPPFRLQNTQTCFRPGACFALPLAHRILRRDLRIWTPYPLLRRSHRFAGDAAQVSILSAPHPLHMHTMHQTDSGATMSLPAFDRSHL